MTDREHRLKKIDTEYQLGIRKINLSMWQMAWSIVVKLGRRGLSENYIRSQMDRILWRIWCRGKEEGTLSAVTWTSGHNWMMRVPFTEEALEDNLVSGEEHEFGVGHIEFEVPVSHPRYVKKVASRVWGSQER